MHQSSGCLHQCNLKYEILYALELYRYYAAFKLFIIPCLVLCIAGVNGIEYYSIVLTQVNTATWPGVPVSKPEVWSSQDTSGCSMILCPSHDGWLLLATYLLGNALSINGECAEGDLCSIQERVGDSWFIDPSMKVEVGQGMQALYCCSLNLQSDLSVFHSLSMLFWFPLQQLDSQISTLGGAFTLCFTFHWILSCKKKFRLAIDRRLCHCIVDFGCAISHTGKTGWPQGHGRCFWCLQWLQDPYIWWRVGEWWQSPASNWA